jgi:hypothetical protein
VNGIKKKVSLTAISAFEISESEAKQYLQPEINQVVEQAKTTFSNITTSSQVTPPNPQSASDILSLLGIIPEELQNHPEATQAKFVNIFNELKELLSASTSQNDVARGRLDSVKETLQAQGINIGDNIEQLPDKIQEILSSSNLEQCLQEIVNNLHNPIAKNTNGQQIDETIQTLNHDIFSEEQKQLEAQRQQKYRQSAQDAIAQSFKSRGLRPFAGGDFK